MELQANAPPQIVFRAFENTDKQFIYSSWLQSFREFGLLHPKGPADETYFPGHRALIDRILGRRPVVRIATLRDDPFVILGFLVAEEPTLHYLYTRATWRRMGVATRLLSGLRIKHYSHWTRAGEGLRSKVLPNTIYNPYT